MARIEITPGFSLEQLTQQGYSKRAARKHPAYQRHGADTAAPLTRESLIAQGYTPDQAANHPALETSKLPSDETLGEAARLALAGAGISTERPVGTPSTVNAHGVVMTEREVGNLQAVRQSAGGYSGSNR